MPFSWKNKTRGRGNRFSRLVADHLQSPKRGGSLVVETGFPTSLIDLYVRNRGRFRKSAAKKQSGNDSSTPLSSCLSSPSFASLTDLNNLSSSGSLADSNNSSSRKTYEIIEEDVVFVGGDTVTSDDEIKIENCSETDAETRMAKLNSVIVVALKVLFMVVLVFETKRFTVGITMSAFLLFFLESVENRLWRRSISITPSVDANSFPETENIRTPKETATLVLCSEEQVESKQEVRSEKELDEVRSEVSCKSSKRAIMKSRMKKLVQKKLRKSSTASKDEICCELKEEEGLKSAQDAEPLVSSNKCSDSEGETLCILKQNQDKIVEIEKGSRMDFQQNPGCLILFLIVLIGLIGGRILALVIALSWCLVLKKIQLRNVKFPIS